MALARDCESAIGGVRDVDALARSGQADISQPTLSSRPEIRFRRAHVDAGRGLLQPGKNTTSLRPFALCNVIKLTISSWPFSTFSITRLTCSKIRPAIEFLHRRYEFFQVFKRPAASLLRRACHISVYPDHRGWSPPIRCGGPLRKSAPAFEIVDNRRKVRLAAAAHPSIDVRTQ